MLVPQKRSLSLLLLFSFLLLWAAGAQEASAAVREAPTLANRIIVVFNSQTLPADAAARVQHAGGRVVSTLDAAGILAAAPMLVDSVTLIRNLKKDSAILDADFDRVFKLVAPAQVRLDPSNNISTYTHFPHPLPTFSPDLPADFFYTSTPQEWGVKHVGAQGGGIAGGMSGAWDVTMGAGATIAILDTGVSPDHPDIAPNLVGNLSEITEPTVCDDGSPADQFGHGTFTAALAAAAAGPGTGLLIGVAPQAHLLNIKVLERVPGEGTDTLSQCLNGDATGDFSWILKGILDATLMGADVISMSLGGFIPRNFPGGGGAALWSAFNRVSNFATARGAVLVAAAGNSALDLNRIGPYAELPAQTSNVIAVMATTNPSLPPPGCPLGTDCLASYSDYGTNLHGLSAPGGDLPSGGCAFSGIPCNPTGFIRSACSAGIPDTSFGLPGPGTSLGCFNFNLPDAGNHVWYVQATGTSAATPLVAGVAALVKSLRPTLSPAQVRTILQRSTQDIGKPGYDPLFNFGLVNAQAAVALANQ